MLLEEFDTEELRRVQGRGWDESSFAGAIRGNGPDWDRQARTTDY
jgi:hypothetical protein